jgi:hypothetical protein
VASRFRVAPAAVRAALRLVRAPEAAVAVPLAPTARRSDRLLAGAAHRGFQISVLTSFALLLGLLAFDTHAVWLASVKLALGTTMLGEGLLLASDWRGARQLTLSQLRLNRPDTRPTRLAFHARLTWKLALPALQLLGVIWLGAGLLTALLGLQGLT